MTDGTYEDGRQDGLKEAIKILSEMERRYAYYISNNPTLYTKDSVKGKLDAARTAKRAIGKLLCAKE